MTDNEPNKNDETGAQDSSADDLDQTYLFSDDGTDPDITPGETNRSTDPNVEAAVDQTIEFDSDSVPSDKPSPLDKSFGPTGTIIEGDRFLDPNQTFVEGEQTIELDASGSDNALTIDSVDLAPAKQDRTVNDAVGKTFETPTVDLGNPVGVGDFATVELEGGLQSSSPAGSDLKETIDPDSVLNGNNITQTIDARALSESDNRIWGMTSDFESKSDSDAKPKPRGMIDRDAITESQVLVPGRQLAGIGSDLGLGSDYELVEVLGEGGMGTVYLARQTSLDRLVALKMVRPLAEDKAEQLRTTGRLEATENSRRNQFLSEAIVTGDLDHPNIVPIHDLALADNNALFYAMKKVDGTPWSKALMDKSQDENLEILLKVCDAIGFAHARGIVHRDLKPENVMLGDYGVVMLMDWGLAIPKPEYKKKESIRKAASLGGSPAYMAPEMATGPVEDIGPSSDIYLLGAILFEVITGRPPHGGNNLTQCLRNAATNKIVDVSSRHDGELMQIARKAMATKPANRFQTVAEMQTAIRQYRSHAESIMLTVRADSDLQRAQETNEYTDYARATFGYEEALTLWPGNAISERGLDKSRIAYASAALQKEDFELGLSLLDNNNSQHQPLIASLQAGQQERDSRRGRLRLVKQVAVGLMAFILIGGSASLYKISKEKNRAIGAERQANTNARLAEAKRREASANAELARRNQVEAEYQKGIAQDEADEADRQRGIATQKAIEAQRNAELAAANEREAVKQEKIAQQQRIIAVKNAEEAIRQRESAVYEAYVAQIGLAKARIDQNEFDDARRILHELKSQAAAGESPGWEWQWLWHQANQAQDDQPLAAAGRSVSIAPAGDRAIVALEDGTAQFFNFDARGEIETDAVVELPSNESIAVTAFSPDQQVIATAGADGVVRLWNARTMQPQGVLRGHIDAITCLKFIDQQQLVSGSRDRTVRLWDLEQQTELSQCWHIAGVNDLAISTAGGRIRLLTSVADDRSGRAVVWDLQAGKFQRTGDFLGHAAPVLAVALSADGRQAASGDRDGRVLVWPTDLAKPIDYASRITLAVKALSRSDQTNREVFKPATTQAFDELIDAQSDQPLRLQSSNVESTAVSAHRDAIESIRFSDDASQLLTTSDDYTIKLWDIASRSLNKTLRGHGGWVRDAVFFPGDNQRIVSAGNDATVRIWRPKTLLDTVTIQPASGVGQSLESRVHDDEIWSATFNGDGTKIVTASRDHTARVIEIDRQTLSFKNSIDLIDDDGRLQEGSPFVALSLAIDSDRNRLFIGSADSTVRVWDLNRGSQLSSARGTGLNTTIAVSTDGTFLVTGSSNEEARLLVWDVAPNGEIATEPKFRLGEHQTTATAIAISPDNRLIFTGDRNGVGILWDSKSGKMVGSMLNQHRGFRINAAQFMPDSKQLLIAADDQNVSRIDLQTMKTVDMLPHLGFVTRVSISPDGKFVATLTESSKDAALTSTATLWNLVNGKDTIVETAVQRSDVITGDASQNQRIVSLRFGALGTLVTSHDHPSADVIKIWNLVSDKPQVGRVLQIPSKLAGLVDTIPLGTDRLLSLNGDATFLWDLKSLNHIRSYRSHGGVTEADFSFDGKYVVTGSRSIRIWDVASGRSLQKMEVPHDGAVRSVQFSPVQDDYTFASGGEDGVCRIWRWDPKQQTITEIRKMQASAQSRQAIHQIRFSPSGQYLLCVGDDAVARLWNLNNQQPPHEFKDTGCSSPFLCAAFSGDEQWIAVGCADRQARIWLVPDDAGSTDQPRSILQGHADQIESIGFMGANPKQLRIMTASRDKSARLWDPRLQDQTGKGREILSLRKHSLGLTAVDATGDGNLMMTASRDGTIILWPAN